MSNQRLVQVQKARTGLTAYFTEVCSVFGRDETIYELMALRKYSTQGMFDTLKEIGVFKVENLSDLMLLCPAEDANLREWGLVNADGVFILGGLYVVPIKDIAGTVIALVGWNPNGGARKYVTTPTLGFSRDTSFFNFDCYDFAWDKWDGVVYLVEGIFDALSLRSIGLPAIANMGLEMSVFKSNMLKRFSKVVAIPDNDRSGKSVNPYTNSVTNKGKKFIWKIENDVVFVTLPSGVKDNDDLVRDYECYDELVACQKSNYVKRL